MPVPNPTPIFRLIHKDNLHIYLRRGGIHAPNNTPDDGLTYKTIHDVEIQSKRSELQIPCGTRGCAHDYVPFYFGYLSPMMFKLKTDAKLLQVELIQLPVNLIRIVES